MKQFQSTEISEDFLLQQQDLAKHGIYTRVVDGIKIHAIVCGWVKYRSAHFHSILGPYFVMLDPTWMDWVPIYAWVIEHPEGTIVIDTGETAQVNKADYLLHAGMNGWLTRQLTRWKISKDSDLKPQLQRLGIEPESVRWVVLTHLHVDHAGGLGYFPKSEIIVSHKEYVEPYVFVDGMFPSWFSPHLIDHFDDVGNIFQTGHVLTEAGDVMIVPTPGHTLHHQSVIFKTSKIHFFFAGDASFNFAHMQAGFAPGINSDRHLARVTLDKIRTYCLENPTAYLPTHDEESVKRFFT